MAVSRAWQGPRRDRGGQFVEYAALIALVGVVAGAVFLTVPALGSTITEEVNRAVCRVLGGEDCGSPDGSSVESAESVESDEGDIVSLHDVDPDPGKPGSQDISDELPVIGEGRAPGEYQVGSFNMGGGHEGEYDPENAAQAIIDSIENREPAVMAIQEACDEPLDAIDEHFGDEYSTVFNQVEVHDPYPHMNNYSGANCKHDGGAFGTGLIVHNDLGFDTENEQHHDLMPDDSDFVSLERRQMVCVTSEEYQLAACTMHLTRAPNSRDDAEDADVLDRSRQAEAERAQEILEQEYGDYTIILGADINAEPDSDEASEFYHPDYGDGAQGSLIDASGVCGGDLADAEECRDGEGTLPGSGRKIDYVFVSDDVDVLGTQVGSSLHSDHDLVWSDILVAPDR